MYHDLKKHTDLVYQHSKANQTVIIQNYVT